VQTLIYHDTVMVCNDLLNYRVEIDDTIGCTSVSSVDGAVLQDGTAPIAPIIDTVSVNLSNGKAEVAWLPSPSPDCIKYYIYRRFCGTGPWFLIDSVAAPGTYYIDMLSNPQAGSVSYSIAAVDSCHQVSAMSPEHCTIFLDPLSVDVCADKIVLQWGSYINMDPPVIGYNVFVSQDGGPDTLLANMLAPNTYFDHTGLVEGATYCYYVQGYNADSMTSSSNTQCIIATKPHQPQYVYMRYATVVDNLYARIGFFVDTTAYVSRYRIYRSTDGITYSELASIPPPSSGSTITYDDLTAQVNAQSYYYKVVVVDSCNLDALTSNVARTIYLSGNSLVYLMNHLEWTPYEDRAPQVYNIQREIDNYDEMHTAASEMWGIISHDDDVAMYTETGGRFFYMIQAPLYDIFMQQYPFADTVYSNMILLLQEPRVYIPNAFTPNGLNPIFKPVGVFTDTKDFIMVIYNRWGEKLFTTTDVELGWDGYYQGKLVEMGSYAYYVRFLLPNGEYFEKRGSVTVLR
jgi:gliding motility-associated-like protein